MHEFGFEQIVSGPTTDYGSLIDHVYIKNCGIPIVNVFDTYPIFVTDRCSTDVLTDV